MSEAKATVNEADSTPTPRIPRPSAGMSVLIAAVLGAVLWTSWTSLVDMYQIWSDDPRYSHGFLVPLFSLFLLYHRRDLLIKAAAQPATKSSAVWWLGLPLIAVGGVLKLIGGMFFIAWFDGISLLPMLAGAAVLLGGIPALRWCWPSIAFLFFMIPLPFRVENALGPVLQRIATLASTYILQTCGLPAQAEQNVINLEDFKIGVVEACNGLGMLMMFFSYATAVAIVIRRPLVDKIILILSAAPIAMIANILRITTTGLLHEFASREIADHVYHDLAGWLMMPMALVMFGTELWLLSKLFVEVEDNDYNPVAKSIEPKGGRPIVSPLLIDVRSIPKGGDSKKSKR